MDITNWNGSQKTGMKHYLASSLCMSFFHAMVTNAPKVASGIKITQS